MSEAYIAYAGIGARATPHEQCATMRRLASHLGCRGYILRSGGAAGADTAFEEGAIAVGARREIFVPWAGYNGRRDGISIEHMPALTRAREFAAAHHPAWRDLRDSVRALMTRNVFQILGADMAAPVKFVVCWAPKPRVDAAGRVCDVEGGTGLAVRVAYSCRIPVFHLGLPEHAQRIEAAVGFR